jgi:hypothetical protein
MAPSLSPSSQPSTAPSIYTPSWTVIDFHDFETSRFGKWSDGGTDAKIIRDAAFATSGIYSVRLRDNSSTSVMTHDPMDVSQYTKLKVSFSFLFVGMEIGEGVWLQINETGNGNWLTVAKWLVGDDFSLQLFYDGAVEFAPAEISSNTNSLQLRFRCDGPSDRDVVYIDDVEISGSN